MRSLRTFIVTFVVVLTLFGIIAYIVASNAFDYKFRVNDNSNVSSGFDNTNTSSENHQNNPSDSNTENSKQNPENNTDISNKTQVSFLFVGTDYQPSIFDYKNSGYDKNGYYVKKRNVCADAFILMKIDRQKKVFMLTSIPPNTIINKTTNKTIGELYSEKGADYMVDCVYALTGIRAEHLAVIGIENCEKALKKIGDITYNVPCDMYYEDEWQNLKIDLKAGMQNLSPKQALNMLRFKDYDPYYCNITREDVIVDFSRALLQKLTSPAYWDKAVSLFSNVCGLFETKFGVNDFIENSDLIYSFQSFEKVTLKYPGIDKEVNGKTLFLPFVSEAVNAFEDYK